MLCPSTCVYMLKDSRIRLCCLYRLRGVELWILTRIWDGHVHGRSTGRSSKHGYTGIPWPTSPRLSSLKHFVFRSQTQYIKPSAQIRLYDAEDVFELMKSHDHELTINDLFEIWKPVAGEMSVEPEPESAESSMTVSKLSEGLGLTEAGHQGL